MNLATKRKTSKPREKLVSLNPVSSLTEAGRLVLEGDGKVRSTKQRARQQKVSSRYSEFRDSDGWVNLWDIHGDDTWMNRRGIWKEDPRNGETGKIGILVTRRDPGKEVCGCYQLKVISHCSCWVCAESWCGAGKGKHLPQTFLQRFISLLTFGLSVPECLFPIPHLESQASELLSQHIDNNQHSCPSWK